jgi:hypothetical protein
MTQSIPMNGRRTAALAEASRRSRRAPAPTAPMSAPGVLASLAATWRRLLDRPRPAAAAPLRSFEPTRPMVFERPAAAASPARPRPRAPRPGLPARSPVAAAHWLADVEVQELQMADEARGALFRELAASVPPVRERSALDALRAR